MTCGVLPPRRRPFLREFDNEVGGCPLPIGHHEPHQSVVVEGRSMFPLGDRRTRYEWDSEDDCGCCDIRDVDRCFWFREVKS